MFFILSEIVSCRLTSNASFYPQICRVALGAGDTRLELLTLEANAGRIGLHRPRPIPVHDYSMQTELGPVSSG
jgi:hypothetical protein